MFDASDFLLWLEMRIDKPTIKKPTDSHGSKARISNIA
jgi:hypothetical protein